MSIIDITKIKNLESNILIAPARAAAEEMHGGVVHEVPDAAADEAIGALVGLRGLDDLLLHGADLAPDAHEAGVLLPVGAGHEAGVVRAQRGGEHAGAPGPVNVGNLQGIAAAVHSLVLEKQSVRLLDVGARDDAHLLSRVGDLGDRRDGPLVGLLARLLHAGVVAVAHRVDAREALLVASPELAIAGLHGQALLLSAKQRL